MSPRWARRGARWSGCLVLLVLLTLAPPARALECASCTHSGLPTSRDLRFGLFPGELVIDVAFAGTWGARLPPPGARGVPSRETGLWFENRWVALLGFTHSLGLELELPLHVGFTSATGTGAAGGAETVHASRSGPGDTWLSLRFARPVGAWTVLATAGLSLPSGAAAASPGSAPTLEAWAEGATSSGSGSWDPLVKLALTRPLGPFELVAVGQGRLSLPGSDRDRWPTWRLFGSVGLAHGAGHRWRYGLSADLLHLGEAVRTGPGGPHATELQLLASGFLQLRVNTWSARLSAHVPLTRWGWPMGRPPGWSHPLRIQLGLVSAFDVGV